MKKTLLALFLATSALTLSFATIGDTAPVLTTEQGDYETDSDQAVCYDLKKNLGPVNTGTYRNADRYTNGEVTKLQQFLHDEGFLIPDPTGFFGPKTKAAVIRYQTSKNFDILSGYTGPMTRAAIKSDTCNGGVGGEGVVACTMEARLCDDGSMMPRGPSDCTWHPNQCPGVTEINSTNVQSTILQGSSTCTVPTYTAGILTNSAAASAGTCTITLTWPTVTAGLHTKVLKWQFVNGTAWFGNIYLTDSSLSSKSKTFTVGRTNVNVALYSDGALLTSKTLSSVCATGSTRDTSTGRCVISGNNTSLNCVSPLVLNTAGTACVSASNLSAAEIQCNAIRTQLGNGWSHYVNANGVCVSASTGATVATSGSAPVFSFNLANNSGDQTATTAKVRWYGSASTALGASVSCVAGGDWAGTKQVPISGDASTIRYEVITRGNFDKNLILTCVSSSGVPTVKSVTVTALQAASTSTGTVNTVVPELVLKINNSKGPIDAVVNRFGGSGTTVLNADWTSNVDVTNCSLGAGFTQYQTAPTMTQITSRSGTITGSLAQRSWASISPQNFDYTMGCKRTSASGYSESLMSNTVRVDTCDVGFHIVRDGSFNGGTCVADAQAAPTCTTTQTLTNGVCVDNTLAGTPAVNLSVDSSSCVIAANQSTCRVSLTANVAGISILRYFTRINGIVTTPVTMTLSSSSVLPLDITNGTTDVVFNGYYGGGSTNIQANKLLTASCASGSTWNGSVCAAGGTVSATPAVPSIAVSPSSVTASQPFTLSITDSVNPANSGTAYNIRITGTTAPTLYATGAAKALTVTPSTSALPLAAGNSYSFQVQACIASVCSAWSGSSGSVSVTSPATATIITPTLWLYSNGVSIPNGGTITASNGYAPYRWESANAASCTLKKGTDAEVSVPTTSASEVQSALLPAGSYSFIYKCINSSGGQASLAFTFVVPVSITANKTSISSIESVLISWSGVGATKYRFTVDGTELPNDTTDTSWSGPLGFPTPPGLGLPAGTHAFKVKAYNGSTLIGESNTVTVILGSTISSVFDSLKNKIVIVNNSILGQGQSFAKAVTGATAVSASGDTCTNITTNLHRGYETPSVSKLQNFLISKGLLSEKASGFFGDLTIEAVKAYQRSLGLPQTGMVYDITRQAIMEETCAQ